MASGSVDNTIKLWNLNTLQAYKKSLSNHIDFAMSMSFSPDGETLASGHNKGCVILWSMNTFTEIKRFSENSGAICAVIFNQSGKLLAWARDDLKIVVWNLEQQKHLASMLGH